jgi:peptidoglycan hydrolase-like protein with peptidoglycan-binding domain
MTSTTSISRIAAVAAGLAMFASVSFAVAPAHAQTAAELQAQISSLLATIQSLQAQLNGTQGSASASFTTDLTIGSTGSQVTALQTWLIAKGYSIPAGATGYFGAQTKAALAAYQAANGISPAAGYFGPITRAKVNAAGGSMTSTGGTTSTVGLTGSGRLTNISSLGDVTSDLHEGDASTKVVGVSVDATDGDVAIQRLDVTLKIAGNGSTNMNKYVTDVSVYLGSTKLASMDPADGDKDGGAWTYRFSGLNGVVKSGTTGNIYVKVTPVSSIGANEDGDQLYAELFADSLRAVGADGISDTYISGTSGQDSSAISQGFTVKSATTGTLTVTASGDNPTASQIAVSSSTTTGVKLLDFNMKAKNSDIDITDLKASFHTSDDNLSDVVNTVYLMKGSTVLKSKTLSSGANGTVTFTDINQTISKDDTENYSIVVDLKGDAAYADGVTLIASTTVLGWDAEDADGASVSPSAAVAGNTQTLTATGISVVKGTVSATNNNASGNGGHDTGTFVIPFTVTAGDNDVFIAGIAATSGATTRIVYATTTTSSASTTNLGSANLTAGNTVTGDSAGNYYKVLAGTSRTFTLTVTYTATATGFTGLQLSTIAYGATSALGSTYSSNLDTFKTNDIQLIY